MQYNVKKTTSVSNALKAPLTGVDINGRVENHLQTNDHILCEVDSLDMWIKFNIAMECPLSSLDVEIEVKVEKRITGSTFMLMVQKVCLQLWNQFCLDSVKAKD